MKTKEDFNFLIGKTLDESKSLEYPYYIFVGEQDGKTFYRPFEYNPYRVIVSISNGIIFRIDDVC